ncbi:hypothetical protein PHSY_004299 [Pseudozyma hubeiensis SY62]|uniref:Uncharacterized protein n=1 Tax=Pseudozyma hubeiensis (strain SY62) TaxID=1305764 RepID=R9PF45_PSEHS|nr:hypothetical protein PHSY_004299 [Pseudozyma hubeiensis SY62]GAC96715.1 hypothetical protein PHSY_004299 [Pseudozyma hubeiensis SY62]
MTSFFFSTPSSSTVFNRQLRDRHDEAEQAQSKTEEGRSCCTLRCRVRYHARMLGFEQRSEQYGRLQGFGQGIARLHVQQETSRRRIKANDQLSSGKIVKTDLIRFEAA